MVLILFFVFCAVTYGAAISWQMIIESDNEYLETAAALVSVLLIGSVSIYVYRRIRAYRQGLNELRQAHPLSPGEHDDPGSVQLRLYLQQIYGRSVDVDALLSRTGGLSTQIIDTLVRSYTYSSEGKTYLLHANDVELGITRTNTASTSSQHITSGCEEIHCENVVDSSSFDSVKCAEEPSFGSASLGNSSISTECSVCLMEFKEGDALSELPCRHIYHRSCVTEWLLLQNACPMCKQSLFVLPPAPAREPALGHPHGVNAGTDRCGLVVDAAIALGCVVAASSEETRAPELPQPSSFVHIPASPVLSLPLPSDQVPLEVVDLEEV